jgi:hypothetical protein
MRYKVNVPSWSECDEKAELLESTTATIASVYRLGGELDPLEKMVHHHDDADPERSKAFISDLKCLVEWCINDPGVVKHTYEQQNKGE